MIPNDVEITLIKNSDFTGKMFSKYGPFACTTDLSVIRGNQYSSTETMGPSYSLKGRIGTYFILDDKEPPFCLTTGISGCVGALPLSDRTSGIRPVLITKTLYEYALKNKRKGQRGIYEVDLGFYPQYTVSVKESEELTNFYKKNY